MPWHRRAPTELGTEIAERGNLIFNRGAAPAFRRSTRAAPVDLQFEDATGRHDYQNGDWETHVMFWRWRGSYGETSALERMAGVYNDEYPKKGMAFALGNQAKRPQTWQLLGVIRLDELEQGELFG
jgi:hypothetical protein